MYNRIILIGNLTKDPELRYTPQGTPVASFGLAVNSRIKQGDEWKEETLFIDIVTFGRQAETVGQFLSKGRQVLVEGRLQRRTWESDGQQRSKFEVIAQAVRFLSKKGGEGQGVSESEIPPPEGITDVEPF